MAMLDGLKSQAVFMLSNVGLGMLINALFAGFVLVKLPFGLANRFKDITQRDIRLPALEASYVTSFSWYMMVIYGTRGLIELFMGSASTAALDEAQMAQAKMGLMGGGGAGQYNPKQAFAQEKLNLKLTKPRASMTAAAQSRLQKS